MKSHLLVLLFSSVVAANECTPKKPNPKNEQCAKDLMKNGIQNLPDDLQNQLMEPLVRKLAKKMMKDMLDDDDCKPKNPQQCSGTSDPGEIVTPFSEGGKKMFEQANKDLNKNANQLVKEVNEKIEKIGKDLKDEVTGEFKHILEELHLPTNLTEGIANIPGHLANLTQDALVDVLDGMKNTIGLDIGVSMTGAGKGIDGLKDKVIEMSKAGLDFVNEKLKDKTGVLVNKTLAAIKGELKGVMTGFVGGLVLDGLTNITDGGLEKKMKWLKSKLSAVIGDYTAKFGIESKTVTAGVIADFVASIPAELAVKEDVKEDAYHNATHIPDIFDEGQETDVEVNGAVTSSSNARIARSVTIEPHARLFNNPITTTTTNIYNFWKSESDYWRSILESRNRSDSTSH